MNNARGWRFLMLSDDDELNENCIKDLFEGIKHGNSVACLGGLINQLQKTHLKRKY